MIDEKLFTKYPITNDLRTKFGVMAWREQMYKQMTADEMVEVLNRVDIHITKQDVLDIYKTNHSSEETANILYDQHPKADELDYSGLYLNADIIYELVDRTILEASSPSSLSDPGLIAMRIHNLNDEDYTPQDLIEILESINTLKKYYEERNLDKLFYRVIGEDSMSILLDLLAEEENYTKEYASKIFDLIMSIVQNYSFNCIEYFFGVALDIPIDVDAYHFDELREKYTKRAQKLFKDCPYELAYYLYFFYRDENDRDAAEKVYQSVIHKNARNKSERLFKKKLSDLYKLQ